MDLAQAPVKYLTNFFETRTGPLTFVAFLIGTPHAMQSGEFGSDTAATSLFGVFEFAVTVEGAGGGVSADADDVLLNDIATIASAMTSPVI